MTNKVNKDQISEKFNNYVLSMAEELMGVLPTLGRNGEEWIFEEYSLEDNLSIKFSNCVSYKDKKFNMTVVFYNISGTMEVKIQSDAKDQLLDFILDHIKSNLV